jgi:hypothetical protein
VRSNCELEFRDVDATKVENGGRNLQVGVYENESLNLPSPARNNRLPPTLRQCQYGLYVLLPLVSLDPHFLLGSNCWEDFYCRCVWIKGRCISAVVFSSAQQASTRHYHVSFLHLNIFGVPNGLIENILKSLLRQSGTFEVSAMNKCPCNWRRTERH